MAVAPLYGCYRICQGLPRVDVRSDLLASIQTSEVFVLACIHSGWLETESGCQTGGCRQTSGVFAPGIEHTPTVVPSCPARFMLYLGKYLFLKLGW
jgi:hypothetical protein